MFMILFERKIDSSMRITLFLYVYIEPFVVHSKRTSSFYDEKSRAV